MLSYPAALFVRVDAFAKEYFEFFNAKKFPNNQRGIPANNQRRQRPRDVERMREYNLQRHEGQFGDGNWANQARNEEAYTEAIDRVQKKKNPPPKKGQRGNPRPKQEAEPAIRPSTTQTAPRDEPLYTGNNRGSKPVKKTLAQNLECSGFIPLICQVYDRIAVEDQRIPRNLPYPIFQHAMCEFLVAFQLHQAKYVLKVPALQTIMDPLAAISAEEYNIPIPIFEYICGFSPTITPTGDKVYWNLPSVAIPKAEEVHNNRTFRSGSFGPITAENHNVYECYISPYITSQYVIDTASHPPNSRRYEWAPLLAGWFPANGVPNENLLGYQPIQRLHPDAIRKCNECTFDDGDSITGRLCHSAYAMNLTSGVLGTLPTIKCTKALFKPKDNAASFVYKERINEEYPAAILWDEPATLKSPFAFSSSTANRANYSAYKRKRDETAIGAFYLVAGEPPDNWDDSRNHNFALQRGFRDRDSLRSNDHEEEEGLGTVTQDVFCWLDTSLINK
uniref:Uncharacterized protein n=1 Tax=Glossina morsitans morsitans TaxID=37546 RepID=A0A1B0FG57_GLOMM